MTRRFASSNEFLEAGRRLVEAKFDNIVVVTGDEGVGKSTFGMQLGCAFDAKFDVSRIEPDPESFMRLARTLHPGDAAQLDDPPFAAKMTMYRANQHLNDFFRRCRGLRLHMLVMYPRVESLDNEFLDLRCRWRIHIPSGNEMGKPATWRPGIWRLYERVGNAWTDATGIRRIAPRWIERSPNEGWTLSAKPNRIERSADGTERSIPWGDDPWPLAEAYDAKKTAWMREDPWSKAAELRRRRVEDLTLIARNIPGKDPGETRFRADVRDDP